MLCEWDPAVREPQTSRSPPTRVSRDREAEGPLYDRPLKARHADPAWPTSARGPELASLSSPLHTLPRHVPRHGPVPDSERVLRWVNPLGAAPTAHLDVGGVCSQADSARGVRPVRSQCVALRAAHPSGGERCMGFHHLRSRHANQGDPGFKPDRGIHAAQGRGGPAVTRGSQSSVHDPAMATDGVLDLPDPTPPWSPATRPASGPACTNPVGLRASDRADLDRRREPWPRTGSTCEVAHGWCLSITRTIRTNPAEFCNPTTAEFADPAEAFHSPYGAALDPRADTQFRAPGSGRARG